MSARQADSASGAWSLVRIRAEGDGVVVAGKVRRGGFAHLGIP